MTDKIERKNCGPGCYYFTSLVMEGEFCTFGPLPRTIGLGNVDYRLKGHVGKPCGAFREKSQAQKDWEAEGK